VLTVIRFLLSIQRTQACFLPDGPFWRLSEYSHKPGNRPVLAGFSCRSLRRLSRKLKAIPLRAFTSVSVRGERRLPQKLAQLSVTSSRYPSRTARTSTFCAGTVRVGNTVQQDSFDDALTMGARIYLLRP